MRKLFNRYLPDDETFKNHPNLRKIRHLLEDPNLWHLNRRSVSKAFAVGLFAAWVPSLGQMFMAAAGAIWFRANLPVSVVLVLITNPLTFAPMFYFAYLVGVWTLDVPLSLDSIPQDFNAMIAVIGDIWPPFLVGCLIVAVSSASVGYVAVRVLWRQVVARQWKHRGLARKARVPKG